MGDLKKETIYILDRSEKILAVLDNKTAGSCPYFTTTPTEKLNAEFVFELQTPANHRDSEYIIEENKAGFWDQNNEFQLFYIKETDDEHGDGLIKTVTCEHAAISEMSDEIVTDKRPADVTADVALDSFINGTIDGSLWKRGQVDALGTATPENAYFVNMIAAINKLIKAYTCETKFRFVVSDTGIDRFIDLLVRRGSDTGKRLEYSKDIISIKRHIVTTGLKTAVIGRGKGEETDSGGNGRRIQFDGVEWSTANGDPVDKPLGQIWVGDPDALEQYGRINENGLKVHRFGTFEDTEETDPAKLLKKTWNHLQTIKIPLLSYEISAVDLYALTGLEHEKVNLGDTVAIIDRELKPAALVEARVIEKTCPLGEPEKTKFVLGNFIPYFTDYNSKIDELEKTINNNRGTWDSAGEPVTDDDFPDTVPPVPANTHANGLFKNIQVIWDYVPESYIAYYEVYASRIAGFAPDPSNLVWRGKTGAYNHEAETDQQWYFKVRAVNTHGTASDFSPEVSAQTVQIATSDVSSVPDFIDIGIPRQDTQPDPNIYPLWVDTSGSIEVMKRWDGVEYVPLAPMTAGDLGTYTADEVDSKLSGYVDAVTYDQDIGSLQDQIDGNITNWFSDGEPTLANYPASDWTTTEAKNKHLGDIYYDNLTGYSYRFQTDASAAYKWVMIQDSDIQKALQDAAKAQDTADQKRRVFVSQPVPPYDVGDLWTQSGEVYRSTATKTESGSFSEGDWVLVGDVTSQKTYTTTEIDTALNGKVSTTTYTTDQQGTVDRFETNESSISQNANDITLKVSKTTYETDITDPETGLQARMTSAESSISQNAEDITLKVSKNGVISSINQTAETIKISAEKVNIDGDLTVTNGLVYIKESIITDANIKSLSADKITAGILKSISIESVDIISSNFRGYSVGVNANGDPIDKSLLIDSEKLYLEERLQSNGSIWNTSKLDSSGLYIGNVEVNGGGVKISRPYEPDKYMHISWIDADLIGYSNPGEGVMSIDIENIALLVSGDSAAAFSFNNVEINSNLDVKSIGSTDYANIPVSNPFETSSTETAWCGVGGVSSNDVPSAAQILEGVNFRIKKTYTPSSISLNAKTKNEVPHITDINEDGFSLYLIPETPNFWYWRGWYTA